MAVPDRFPPEGEALSDDEEVFRVAKAALVYPRGAVAPQSFAKAFELSGADKSHDPPRLSVWAHRLTKPHQAAAIMDRDADELVVLTLRTGDVRALQADPPDEEMPGLDVVWERATRPNEAGRWVLDERTGAEGHAGIEGLLRPPKVPKKVAFSYRSQLTDLAAARGAKRVSEW